MFNKDIVLSSIVIIVLAIYCVDGLRSKRAAYELPSGSELLIGSVSTSFQCSSDGYFADVDNGCQLFHICTTAQYPDGKSEIIQHTFLCGNQTIFNQLSFTCDFPEESIPCENARDFLYLNERIGEPKVLFHDDNDIERAAPLIASRRGRIIESKPRPLRRPVAVPQTLAAPPPPPPPSARRPGRRGNRRN